MSLSSWLRVARDRFAPVPVAGVLVRIVADLLDDHDAKEDARLRREEELQRRRADLARAELERRRAEIERQRAGS